MRSSTSARRAACISSAPPGSRPVSAPSAAPCSEGSSLNSPSAAWLMNDTRSSASHTITGSPISGYWTSGGAGAEATGTTGEPRTRSERSRGWARGDLGVCVGCADAGDAAAASGAPTRGAFARRSGLTAYFRYAQPPTTCRARRNPSATGSNSSSGKRSTWSSANSTPPSRSAK